MRPIRQTLFAIGVALALLLPLGGAASADPGDPGGFAATTIAAPTTGRPMPITVIRTASADPGDPGGY